MKIIKLMIFSVICFMTILFFSNKVLASSFDGCNELITFGDTDSCVSELQNKLNDVEKCNLVVDGIFGNDTYECVKSFQSKHGLAVDGIVGVQTKLAFEYDDNEYLIVNASRLNIRKKANIKSAKIIDVSRGSVLKLIDYKIVKDSKWYKVKYNEYVGYVDASYVKDDFIVINISNQRLDFYKNNKMFLTTPIVSGTYNKHDTPKGYFKINDKDTDTYLRGKNADGSNYKSYVNYWMPFNKGIGLHDATWRGNGTNLNYFGNNIYKSNGSHGCINMPLSAAKTVYENVSVGTIVVVK